MSKGWLFIVEDGDGSFPVAVGIEDATQARQAALDAVQGFGVVVMEKPLDDAGLAAVEVRIGERLTKIRQAVCPRSLH
ncbi:hypothetical protein ACLB6G_05705 [Zhengella sp. ZM62]|uniref:hypothetical protein n=1 Tax=Zhengella sedimenti TaxID=3390035 RepID=UPI00397697D7